MSRVAPRRRRHPARAMAAALRRRAAIASSLRASRHRDRALVAASLGASPHRHRARLAGAATPHRHCGRLAAERGQSAIETLGLLPLILLVALSLAQLLATGAAHSAASTAAEAAATAVLHHTDPTTAARSAAPDWSASRMTVVVTGRHIRIRIRPRSFLPGAAGLFTTTAEADAGPVAKAATPTRRPAA